ncbi:MAG: hypothetical protein ACRDNO_22045 [Trebonia sp.]
MPASTTQSWPVAGLLDIRERRLLLIDAAHLTSRRPRRHHP